MIEYDGHIPTEMHQTIDGDYELIILLRGVQIREEDTKILKVISCPDFRSTSEFSSGHRTIRESGEFKFIGRINHAKMKVITQDRRLHRLLKLTPDMNINPNLNVELGMHGTSNSILTSVTVTTSITVSTSNPT